MPEARPRLINNRIAPPSTGSTDLAGPWPDEAVPPPRVGANLSSFSGSCSYRPYGSGASSTATSQRSTGTAPTTSWARNTMPRAPSDGTRVIKTKIVSMADVDRDVLAALNYVWERIRQRDPRVLPVVFSLQPRRPSWCNTVEWDTPGAVPVLIVNLADGDRIVSGTELMTWLLHMAAHSVPGGTSQSAEGRFHPVAFRDAAESIGLTAERGLSTMEPGDAKHALGYARISLDKPAPYRAAINRLDKALAAWDGQIVRHASRGPVSLACKCTPETLPARDRHTQWPRIIRASRGIASERAASAASTAASCSRSVRRPSAGPAPRSPADQGVSSGLQE